MKLNFGVGDDLVSKPFCLKINKLYSLKTRCFGEKYLMRLGAELLYLVTKEDKDLLILVIFHQHRRWLVFMVADAHTSSGYRRVQKRGMVSVCRPASRLSDADGTVGFLQG